MRHWRAFVFVLLFVGSFLLAGCGGEGAAGGTATPVVSAPDLVVSATAEPPVPPFDPGPFPLPTASPEMARDDRVGAEAAVRYFVNLLNYTYSTGDTSVLLSQSDPEECRFCVAVTKRIDQFRADGESRQGGRTEVASIVGVEELGDRDRGSWFVVRANLKADPHRVIDGNGKVMSEGDFEYVEVAYVVSKRDATWILINAGIEE